MKKLTISLFPLFLINFSLSVVANDALLSEIIRLDEERRAEIKTLHIEYDFSEQLGDGSSYKFEARGQVWEQLGKGKYRFRVRVIDPAAADGRLRSDMPAFMRDVSVDSSVRYELKVPYEAFPVTKPLELCKITEYQKQRYSASITKSPDNVWQTMIHPFFTLPIIDFDERDSFRALLEKHTPNRVEKIQDDVGDEIVQVELSGMIESVIIDEKVEKSTMTSPWSMTVDFNLSKGGLVSKYLCVRTPGDSSYSPEYHEGAVARFEESQPGSGHWYPQEYRKDYYQDPAKKWTSTYSITNFTLNKKSENQLGPVQFPEGMIVYETDVSEEGKWVIHIWGKNKSKKKFTDGDEFYEYLVEHCPSGPYAPQEPPKSVSSIRIVLLFLGALFIVAGLYMRRRRKVS